MKTYKQISIIGIFCALFVVQNISAALFGGPTVKSHTLTLPKNTIENGSTFPIAIYKHTGENTKLSMGMSSYISKQLSVSWPAAHNVLLNPWLKPNCYKTSVYDVSTIFANNEIDVAKLCEKAKSDGHKAIMYGMYNYTSTEDSTGGEKNYKTVEGIPFSRNEFNYKLSVDIQYDVKVVNAENQDVLYVTSIKKNELISTVVNDISVRPYDKVTKTNDILFSLSTPIANEIVTDLMPTVAEVKYDFKSFKKLKGEQKEFEKSAEKAIKNADEAGMIKLAYFNYDKLSTDAAILPEETAKAFFNCGLIQELVGNYEKAIEMYQKASKLDATEKDYAKAITQVKAAMEVKQFFNKIGIETPEVDLTL